MSTQREPCDGTVRCFLLRVALERARLHPVTGFAVSPEAWQALAYETNFASISGTRFTEELEIRTCTGWVRVVVSTEMGRSHGVAFGNEDVATLGFGGVL